MFSSGRVLWRNRPNCPALALSTRIRILALSSRLPYSVAPEVLTGDEFFFSSSPKVHCSLAVKQLQHLTPDVAVFQW